MPTRVLCTMYAQGVLENDSEVGQKLESAYKGNERDGYYDTRAEA